MISETEHYRHKVDLEFLETTLKNAGIPTSLILASDKNPVSFLNCIPDSIYTGPKAIIQLIFIPAEDILEERRLRRKLERNRSNTPTCLPRAVTATEISS